MLNSKTCTNYYKLLQICNNNSLETGLDVNYQPHPCTEGFNRLTKNRRKKIDHRFPTIIHEVSVSRDHVNRTKELRFILSSSRLLLVSRLFVLLLSPRLFIFYFLFILFSTILSYFTLLNLNTPILLLSFNYIVLVTMSARS